MEIILEYVYTGSIKEESLTKNNTIEAFYAADYFQLTDLQDFITNKIKNTNFAENNSPELLSKISETVPLIKDDYLLNLLVEIIANTSLNNIEFGRLSTTALQCLLSITLEKEKSFVTPEYEVFRYSAILAAKQVSNGAYKTLTDLLPTLNQIENQITVGNKFIIDREKVVKELEPLVEFIDFKRIKPQILADIIEPLEIIPYEIISNVYRYVALSSNFNLSDTRGKSTDYVWDESICGSRLIIVDNGKMVKAPYDCSQQSVRAKMALENNGIFEWDVIIEKICNCTWVGICASENFNCEIAAGKQSTGWALGSNGCCRHSAKNTIENYCPSFGEGTKVTVHLDMNKRTCAFTINGIKYREVSEWNDLPSKLYPVVSLSYPGRFRIQPHKN
ncbi:hypothetical protein GLOIN_2v1487378 [Rhizophagus clarus]|nr:hypothetical protein GLOIN_2v1487378 [Rhizophagus clarus]